MSVSSNPFVGLFVLLFRFLELDGIDLDAVFGMIEIVVDGESVGLIDIPALGALGKNTITRACERLQCAFQLRVN